MDEVLSPEQKWITDRGKFLSSVTEGGCFGDQVKVIWEMSVKTNRHRNPVFEPSI